MKTSFKLLLLVAVLLMSSALFGQNYNINIGGLPITSGPAVPGSCPVDGGFFFKNTATESWSVCIGGAYVSLATGSSSGTVTNTGGALTANAVVLGAGTNDTKVSTGITTDGISRMTLGVVSTTLGTLTLAATGGTGGAATIAAGTGANSNAFTFHPQIAAGGSLVNPIAAIQNSTNGNGMAGFETVGAGGYGWGPSTNGNAVMDTGLSRDAAGVVDVGNGTAADTSGRVQAAGYISKGTKFTSNAGCGESAGTITGGASKGKLTTAGTTSCTTVITLPAAPNGWACAAVDLTTPADAANPHQTATTTTTATIVSGTIVSGDVLQISCDGY